MQSSADRRLHRLWYETRDWCRSVRDEPNPGTHRAAETAAHSPEVWDSA